MSDNMARTEVADHAWQPLRIFGRGFNKLGLATGPAQVKTVPVGLDQAFGHQPSYKALDLNMFVARWPSSVKPSLCNWPRGLRGRHG